MPSRTQQSYGVTYTDGTSSNAYVTSSRQTRFLTLSMIGPDNKAHALGAVQNFSLTQSNGGRYEPQASDDYLEIIFGMRQWSATFSRRALRGADMEEMALRLYPDMSDLDWREIPLILQSRYFYSSYNAAKTFEDTNWQLRKCFITDYRQDQIPNATDVMRESVTVIAAGYARTLGNGKKLAVPDAVVGASFFSAVTSNGGENSGGSQAPSGNASVPFGGSGGILVG